MASPFYLEELLAAIRARIGSNDPDQGLSDLGVQIWRIADGSDLPQGAAHKGVTVGTPASVRKADGGGRRRATEEVFTVTSIQVTVYVRVQAGSGRVPVAGQPAPASSGYGASEDEALVLARLIRKRLTSDFVPIGTPSPGQGDACIVGGLEWNQQIAGTHPASKGWYRVTLQFDATHLIDLGE